MKISMSSQVLEELKASLSKSGKTAARFVVNGFGCRGPLFDIELSDQKDGDVTADVHGIKFIVENDLAVALKSPEIVKQGDKFMVKRSACGC